MTRLIVLLIFITHSCAVHSQTNVEYDLYLLLDTNRKDVVYTNSFGNDDLMVKMFMITKNIPQESQKYSLAIDAKGKLTKGLKGGIDNRNGTLAFSHTIKKDKKKQVLKISDVNFLDLETILNTKFSEVLSLVQKSRQIYIIDIAEEDTTSNFYTAYEVQR